MKKTKQTQIFGSLLFLLLSSITTPAAAIQNDYSSNPYHQIYQSIINTAVRQGLTGLVLLIKTPEEGTWIGTAGYSRIEDKTPVGLHSLFSCQSFTKTYTAAAIMLLKDDGLIDFDATIDTYLPDEICDNIANGHLAINIFDFSYT